MPRPRKSLVGGYKQEGEKPVVEEVVSKPDENSVAEQLKKLGMELAAVAENELAGKEKIKQIESLLGSLQIKDYPQLAESPVVQSLLQLIGADHLRPGEAVNRGTLAERDREWTWQDVNREIREGRMKLVKFSASESIPITWNGLSVNLPAHRMVEVPEPFYNIYMEHVFAMEQAARNEAYLLGHSDEPPHRDWQTPEGAIVRAVSIQGRRYGKPSGTLGVGPIYGAGEVSGEQES